MRQFSVIMLLLFVTCFSSCKKEKNVTVPGYWKGSWSSGASSTHNNMATVFRSNGTVRVIYGYTSDTAAAIYKSEGTYTLDGDQLRFRYNEGSYVFIHRATLSNKMNGTWGYSPSETNAGLFALDKQ